MRRIDLDYQRRPTNRLGWALLFIGALAAAGASLASWQQGQSLGALQEQLTRLERERLAARSSASREADPLIHRELPETKEVEGLLNRRWSQLFDAMEGARSADIALLSLEPEADRGTLRLTAEARSKETMLAYLAQLEQTPVLHNPVLVEHRIQRQDPQRPIRFALQASWEQTP